MKPLFLPLALVASLVSAHAQGVQKRTLDNGLTVLVQENRTAPVVAVRIYVKTGSIYENQFLGSGISHLFEHTLFEGTKTRDKKQLNDEIQAIGGQMNAYTSYDVTAYHLTTAAPYFGRALGVLSDMTQNSTFPDAEVKVQQGVIHNEMNLGEDDAERALSELFYATAFRVHPVRYSIIGFRSQFDRITRDDILSYYRSHYTPENSILSIAGDVSAPAVFAAAQKEFGAWERQAPQSLALPPEPAQSSPRRAVIEKDVNLTYLEMGWHSVPLQSPDLYALDTLAEILGGSDSSRLVREIQEKRDLVVEISASSSTPNYDAGVFGIHSVMPPQNLARVEAAVRAEIEKIKRNGVTNAELLRAKRQIRASFVFGKQGVDNQAEQNAYDELGTGDPTYSSRYVERIGAVTNAQIQAVARKYLLSDGLTTAVVKPRSKPAPRVAPKASKPAIKPVMATPKQQTALRVTVSNINSFLRGYKAKNGGKAPASLAEVEKISGFPHQFFLNTNGKPLRYDAKRGEVSSARAIIAGVSLASLKKHTKSASRPAAPRVVTLPNGLKLILRPNRSAATVSMVVQGAGGSRVESEAQSGISGVAAQMVVRGTTRRSEEQIAALVDDLGGSLGGFAGSNSWGLASSWLASDWKRGLNLMAESTFYPTFPETELSKVKSQFLNNLSAQNDDPMSGASILLKKTFFGKHPYGRNPLGTRATIQSLNRAKMVTFWNRTVQPRSMVLAISGDFDAVQMEKTARMLFGSYRAKVAPPRAPRVSTPPPRFKLATRTQPGIAQAVQWFGFPSVGLKSEDRYALDVLDAAMSGSDLPGGRLHERLRNDQLVYVVHAYDSRLLDSGMFTIYAASTAENRAKTRAIIEEEVAKVRESGISSEELERAKTMMISSHAIGLQTNDAIARDLASNQLFGLGIEQSARYAAKINAVTLEDVQRVAQKYLRMENAALAVVEPAVKAS